MRTHRTIAALMAAGLLLASCGTSGSEDGDPAEPGEDETTSPDDAVSIVAVDELEPGDEEIVGEAVNAFGFDLLGVLSDGEDNAVTSPVSVATALAMVLAGSGGDTAEAMADVLHLDDTRDVRVGALLAELVTSGDVTFTAANGLWADDDVPFQRDYLDFVQETFGATLEEADLASQATADEIDAWVEENTNGLIDSIAADLGLPSAGAVLVLLNAVYFLGEWTTQFETADTRDEPFTLADGSQVDVPLMHLREQDFEHAARPGFQMLRLPYGDDERYAMEVLLPDQSSSLASMMDTLDAAEWRAASDSLTERTVDELALPRFELEWSGNLNAPLSQLGMGVAFDPDAADFRPMSPAEPFIDDVVHKTFIRVDEEGTEAAAVTGAEMGIVSAPADELVFRVDRPFAFTISDRETGTILFLGTVADPRG